MKKILIIIATIIISFILLPNIYNAFEIQQEDGSYKTVKNIPYSGYKYSYTKCNGSKVKDNDVIYNEETQSFTMNDIREISRCNFYFDKDGNEIITKHTVNVTVLNGTVDNPSKIVTSNEKETFNLTPTEGYSSPNVTCTNNQEGTIKENILTVENITEDTTCTVTYEEKTYKIKYNANGGTGAIEDSEFTYDKTSALKENTFTKEGYVFLGWSTNKDATEATYRDEQEVSNLTTESEVTLYAVWKKLTEYILEFNDNGGTGGPGILTAKSAEPSYTFTIPATEPARDGYIFAGWKASSTTYKAGDKFVIYNNSDDSAISYVLRAVWAKEYTATLNTNGAEQIGNTNLSCIATEDSCTITLPTITAKEGFEVVGWSTNKDATTAEVNAGDEVTVNQNKKYYAITKSSQPLSATFKPNGATIDNATTDVTKTCYRYNGANTCDITTPNITREGWTIIGWGTKEDAESSTNEANSSISISSNITRYAVTKKNIYITYFDDDDNILYEEGHTVYNNQDGFFHEIISLELDSREGYDFRGWSEIKNDTEIPWAYGDESYFTESTNLYPVWKIKTYTANVTVLNGTVDGETSKTVNHGSNATFAVNPSSGFGNPTVSCTNSQIGPTAGPTVTAVETDYVEQAGGDILTIKSVSNDTTCTVEYFKLTTSEACFAFNSTTGTITDYYNYQGGGTSGTACPRDVVIPSTIKNVTITKIGSDVFWDKGLTSVVIPNTVTTIGDNAFNYNDLTTVVIPDSVTTIGSNAFYYNLLDSVTLSKTLTTIGEGAFASNELTSVIIPDSVKTIGTDAFNYNQLGSVTIGNSVTSIGVTAFSSNQLTTVTIPDSVISIGWNAFAFNNLTTVTIGKSVTTIEDTAFYISGIFNSNLTRIINKTGRKFNWGLITSGTSGNNFITGSFTTPTGKTLTVSAS